MSNNSIDDFKVLSPSEKKELERKRQEQERQRLEAEERARLAAEEKARKAKEAAQKAKELTKNIPGHFGVSRDYSGGVNGSAAGIKITWY